MDLVSSLVNLDVETGITFGKDSANTSVKPSRIAALIDRTLWKLLSERCSLLSINKATCLKSSKSSRFLVNKGYL